LVLLLVSRDDERRRDFDGAFVIRASGIGAKPRGFKPKLVQSEFGGLNAWVERAGGRGA
jgi:hypothetical protein